MSSRIMCLVLLVLLTPTEGWWCTGHMLVAEIARQSILKKATWEELQQLAVYMHIEGGFQRNPTALEGACWADDLKGSGLETMEVWHYINMPYNPDNLADMPEPDPVNIVTTIQSLLRTMHNANANNWEKSFTALNLVHLIGDIHQPLHAATLFSDVFPPPLGDEGGNKFFVHYQNKKMKLHSFWDSVGELYSTDLERPLGALDSNWIQNTSAALLDQFHLPDAQVEEGDVHKWALESVELAEKVVYNGLTPDKVLTEEYVALARETAKRQITLAGLRLARAVTRMFQKEIFVAILV